MPIQVKFLAINLLLCIICHPASSQTRQYKSGDHYRYRMTTEVVHNGKWQSTIVAVCELYVKNDSNGIPYDEVHWVSKKVITAKDTTDQSNEARQVPPYRISLHAKGELNLPKITVAGMTGEITDFNTFFVAISPKLGIGELKNKGDRHLQKEPLEGDFSNGQSILVGNDCLAVTVTLTNNTKDKCQLETNFMPPADSCLNYLLPDLKQPVVTDVINNFQMVRPFSNNRFNVLFGKEDFTIKSTVQKKDGKLTEAGMVNNLTLKIKLNCDAQYGNCQTTMPFTILRTLKLELLNDR